MKSEEYDPSQAARLAEFNEELGKRLAALDRGEAVKPADFRARLQARSEERRQAQPPQN
jgi:hypothetical protein